MSAPFFSVLIPSYNRPELIGAAVASVLANDWPDFELIISDNQSPRRAEIVQVLQPFLADPRVQLHLQPQNLYEAGNRDFLTQTARGEWHVILCDDDKLYPHALRTLANAIARTPTVDLFTFGYTIVDEHDRVAYSRAAPKSLLISPRDARLTRELLVADAFPFWLYHPATFCARRTVRDRIKPNRTVGIGDDIMFLIDYVNANGAIQVVPAVLMYYRRMTPGTSLETNQSAEDLPNLVTRAKILLHLSQRGDLQPLIRDFVGSREFRQRLLYDPVLWTGVPAASLLREVPLPEKWTRELQDFQAHHSRRGYRRRLAFRRVRLFISLFGFAGVRALATVALQRARQPA